MAAFGFSVGDVIATVELCRKLIGALQTTTGAAAKYQRTVIELENLTRVLRGVESLAASEPDDNHQRINSIRAVSLATMFPTRSFSQELMKYEASLFPSAKAKTGGAKKMGRAMQWTVDMDEEIQKFQLYVSGQLLSITTLLQLLERDIASAREARRIQEHRSLIALLTAHSTSSTSIGGQISNMSDEQAQQSQAIQQIAMQGIRNGRALLQMQQSILSMTSISSADIITLDDPLGRTFNLPYAYFQQWELVQNFIQHQFAADTVPGAAQVKAGDFFIARKGTDKALTTSNWRSNVFPGVTLNMTVVFTLMQVQLRRCPRPGCGSINSDALESSGFITCAKCQLTFRFDPDLTAIGLQTEDEKLRLAQQNDDLDYFGRRQSPADIIEILSDDGQVGDAIASDQREVDSLSSTEQHGVMGPDDGSDDPNSQQNADEGASSTSSFHSALTHQTHNSSSHSQAPQQARSHHPADLSPPDREHRAASKELHFDHDKSSLDAWLESSAVPATPSHVGENPTVNESFERMSRMRAEMDALRSLNRVHFIQKVPETRPLIDTVRAYCDMSLDAQIFLRKVVDKFPALPPYLAKRFANANVKRADRLRAMNSGLEAG